MPVDQIDDVLNGYAENGLQYIRGGELPHIDDVLSEPLLPHIDDVLEDYAQRDIKYLRGGNQDLVIDQLLERLRKATERIGERAEELAGVKPHGGMFTSGKQFKRYFGGAGSKSKTKKKKSGKAKSSGTRRDENSEDTLDMKVRDYNRRLDEIYNRDRSRNPRRDIQQKRTDRYSDRENLTTLLNKITSDTDITGSLVAFNQLVKKATTYDSDMSVRHTSPSEIGNIFSGTMDAIVLRNDFDRTKAALMRSYSDNAKKYKKYLEAIKNGLEDNLRLIDTKKRSEVADLMQKSNADFARIKPSDIKQLINEVNTQLNDKDIVIDLAVGPPELPSSTTSSSSSSTSTTSAPTEEFNAILHSDMSRDEKVRLLFEEWMKDRNYTPGFLKGKEGEFLLNADSDTGKAPAQSVVANTIIQYADRKNNPDSKSTASKLGREYISGPAGTLVRAFLMNAYDITTNDDLDDLIRSGAQKFAKGVSGVSESAKGLLVSVEQLAVALQEYQEASASLQEAKGDTDALSTQDEEPVQPAQPVQDEEPAQDEEPVQGEDTPVQSSSGTSETAPIVGETIAVIEGATDAAEAAVDLSADVLVVDHDNVAAALEAKRIEAEEQAEKLRRETSKLISEKVAAEARRRNTAKAATERIERAEAETARIANKQLDTNQPEHIDDVLEQNEETLQKLYDDVQQIANRIREDARSTAEERGEAIALMNNAEETLQSNIATFENKKGYITVYKTSLENIENDVTNRSGPAPPLPNPLIPENTVTTATNEFITYDSESEDDATAPADVSRTSGTNMQAQTTTSTNQPITLRGNLPGTALPAHLTTPLPNMSSLYSPYDYETDDDDVVADVKYKEDVRPNPPRAIVGTVQADKLRREERSLLAARQKAVEAGDVAAENRYIARLAVIKRELRRLQRTQDERSRLATPSHVEKSKNAAVLTKALKSRVKKEESQTVPVIKNTNPGPKSKHNKEARTIDDILEERIERSHATGKKKVKVSEDEKPKKRATKKKVVESESDKEVVKKKRTKKVVEPEPESESEEELIEVIKKKRTPKKQEPVVRKTPGIKRVDPYTVVSTMGSKPKVQRTVTKTGPKQASGSKTAAKKPKQRRAPNKWNMHMQATRDKYPGLDFVDLVKKAKATYK